MLPPTREEQSPKPHAHPITERERERSEHSTTMQLKRADRREVYTLFWSVLFTLCFDLFCLYSVWLFCFRQDKESWTLGSRKDTSFKYKHKYVTCEHKTVMHTDKNNKYKQLCTRQWLVSWYLSHIEPLRLAGGGVSDFVLHGWGGCNTTVLGLVYVFFFFN